TACELSLMVPRRVPLSVWLRAGKGPNRTQMATAAHTIAWLTFRCCIIFLNLPPNRTWKIPAPRGQELIGRGDSMVGEARSRNRTAENSGQSVRQIARVVLEEIRVNRFASGKAFVHAVPVADAGFAHFPAQVHFLAVEEGREVDQTYVEILDDAAIR